MFISILRKKVSLLRYQKQINLKAKVTKKSLSVSFKDVASDTYAISVYHDIDGNGKINQNFLGIPKEPVGISNNANGFMELPKYNYAKFNIKSNKQITINLRNQ